jgi:hypothetical protein
MAGNVHKDPERARKVRRSAIALGLVALAFYLSFILMSVTGYRS